MRAGRVSRRTDAATIGSYCRHMLVVPIRNSFEALAALASAKAPPVAALPWSTSSFGDTARTSTLELFNLGEHLQRCQGSRGRLFAGLCLKDSLGRFLAPRFITTLVAIAMVGATLAML